MIDRWIKRLLGRKSYSVEVTGRLSKIRYTADGRSLSLEGEMLTGDYDGVIYLRSGCVWYGSDRTPLTKNERKVVQGHLAEHFGPRIQIR